MKKQFFTLIFGLIAGIFMINEAAAQRSEWVNQVIVANSGKYESAPPYTDYVTVQSYDPVSQVVTVFGTIYTQSAQDVIIIGNKAWVAAEDSIVLYNIDTYQRIAAVADSGISRLLYFEGKLAVTKKFPVSRFYVEILDAESLALLGLVQNISGDCGEAIFERDTLFVAVNGGTTGTEGKLAVISKNNWMLQREINFGTNAIGITNLFSYSGNIIAVNKTPIGSPAQGSLTVYNPNNTTFSNKLFSYRIGEGYGLKSNLLFLGINYGIGSIDLNSFTIADPVIVEDPGSLANIFINSAGVDYLNSQLYINIGNRPPAFAIGVVTTTAGDSVTSYTTGLNADAIAIDYRVPAGVNPGSKSSETLSVYPSPATDILYIKHNDQLVISDIRLTDMTGRVLPIRYQQNNGSIAVNVSQLPEGLYFITVKSGEGLITGKFIKK